MAQNKRAGKKSLAQNDFIPPLTPINVVGTDVGTNRPFNNGAVSVAFSLPSGSPSATSYTVTASPGGATATGSSSPIVVTGLASNTAYTFTVTATNSFGTTASSSPSASVTVTTVPATPSAPTATAGVNQDTVSWSAPLNGGKAITQYFWQSSDGKSGTTTGTSVTVAQEANTAQTYQVRADNANGQGQLSASSNSVTTQAPFFPPFFPFFPSFGPFFPPFFPFFPPFFPSFGPFFPPAFGPFFPPYFCPDCTKGCPC